MAEAGSLSQWPHRPLRHIRRKLAPCPEIDCVRHLLPPAVLAAAELRAVEIGTGADRVLVAQSAVSEEQYARALAFSLGCRFDSLERVPRAASPAGDADLIEAAKIGLLWLVFDQRRILVVAPQQMAARHLANMLRARPGLRADVWLTTSRALLAFVRRCSRDAVNAKAAYDLHVRYPQLSARVSRPRLSLRSAAICALVISASIAVPDKTTTGIATVLAIVFLCWALLRLAGAVTPRPALAENTAIADDDLPVYSIIIALYREAASVPGLVASLKALDYPQEKLDIKFVLERDDHETWRAIDSLRLGPPFTVLFSADAGPRTKPKALNTALPFAMGEYVAVYDAEDRPDSDQLKRTLQAFAAGGPRLACVQARLSIDNAADSCLTRLFAAEYAGLFDVFLPGIAAWRLPLPLGGSSNHFRISVLRSVGAWDPYNVTEDADLGTRLARRGFHTAVIASTTYEEAPAHLASWIKQRTRWFKGWMQTWLVHMRHPLALWRDLGTAGFLTFQLVVGGTVLAALVHSVFMLAFGWQVVAGEPWTFRSNSADILLLLLYGGTFAAGYAISALVALFGLRQRKLMSHAWALLLMPFYWLLLSLAAWRALGHLILRPHQWEKTEHGLARTSRRAQHQARTDTGLRL